jgi:glycosyltransferase involved in cell wall biosynthesis
MNNHKPQISIVTPSYNMMHYLKRCAASIKDQNIFYEHIVMDGGSTDGTKEWLVENTQIISESRPDKGMYHALNKAIALTKGDIIAHLNSDEQYLPHTLAFVIEYFKNNPDIDFLAGDFLVVDPDGNLVAYRKAFTPRWPYFFSNYLYTTTCALFYRRKVFDVCKFDESYKSIADVIFLYSALKNNFKGVHIKRYFSTFTYSGANLSLNSISDVEKSRFRKTLPIWFRTMSLLFKIFFFIEKWVHGTYNEKSPISYSIYDKGNLKDRAIKTCHNPTFRLRFKAHANT